MIAMKIGRTRIRFLREVFASLAVRGSYRILGNSPTYFHSLSALELKNVIKFERARIHSTNNVFSAVAVVAAWGP